MPGWQKRPAQAQRQQFPSDACYPPNNRLRTRAVTHRTPLLWRLHRVHHADNAVDLSTSYRNHPLELLITLPVSAAVVLIVGIPQSIVVITQTLLVGVTLWQHADIALPRRLDRALSWVIVTPRLHRLHHNPERATHDSNYGELLTLWDRLFGTFNRTAGRCEVGLDDQVARPDRLLQQIWSPVYGS
jgi:sterol desaturase/sphingolipid hydroxylase (fatty acid hydroxylase superfamily)